MKEVLQFLKDHEKHLNNLEQEKYYFWKLGQLIVEHNLNISQLSWYLQQYYGNLVLVSKRNLHYMVLFSETYSANPTLLFPNITWYQHILIMQTKTTIEQKQQLLQACNREKWTTSQLKQKIREGT